MNSILCSIRVVVPPQENIESCGEARVGGCRQEMQGEERERERESGKGYRKRHTETVEGRNERKGGMREWVVRRTEQSGGGGGGG